MSLIDQAIKKLYQYVDAQVDGVRPFRAVVIGQSSGMVQIRRLHSTSGETALRARGVGFDLSTDDEVLCVPMADGIPVVVLKLQRSAPSSLTLTPNLVLVGDLTVDDITADAIVAATINSPASTFASQNSADTATNASTSTYETTLTTNIVLPTGTWTIRALSTQMLSHSASGGVVRAQTRIGGTAGTSLSAALPKNPIRASMSSVAVRTGQSGTVAVDAQYRPNASGTASSGGGLLAIWAYRTA